MSIDWDGGNRKKFRLALERAYPNPADLERFIDEELNENLALLVPTEENLTTVISHLLKWAKSQGRIDELFNKFCQENTQIGNSLISEIKPLVKQKLKIAVDEWTSLFALFDLGDLDYLRIAFRQAFQDVHNQSFVIMRPDRPPTENLVNIQDLLASYDDPVLAVRFVEFALNGILCSSEHSGRDLTPLKDWRDRIASEFQVPAVVKRLSTATHAYLLITIEENGLEVNVYPELRVVDVAEPVRFGAKSTTCPLKTVATEISEWIRQAEEALLDCSFCENKEVVLELFLPCRYLIKDEDDNIATNWNVLDRRGEAVQLGTHRLFLMRSEYRVRDRHIQARLNNLWPHFQRFTVAGTILNKFHEQTAYPSNRGSLRAIINGEGALGLKLIASMPVDHDQRTNSFHDIIDSAIPIVLWSSQQSDLDATVLLNEFNDLLACDLNDFAAIAERWRLKRIAGSSIKLLCDRPDRLPNLPDPQNRPDTDALVAS